MVEETVVMVMVEDKKLEGLEIAEMLLESLDLAREC